MPAPVAAAKTDPARRKLKLAVRRALVVRSHPPAPQAARGCPLRCSPALALSRGLDASG